ncbi:MAG TPA: DUF296 domain-containing protein [archaeon]|nr:DUF296 domain-containing protein [archaeon]
MSGNELVLKMNNNADIIKSIEKFAEDNSITYGIFQKGEGRIREIDLVSHGRSGSIIGTKSEGDFEIDTVSGQIRRSKSGECVITLRLTISSSGFTGKEGQLMGGKASGHLELTILKKEIGRIIEA